MYYIKKNKGNNISSYDITQEEANKITYKYFGVKDIDISKEDDNFSIKKKNEEIYKMLLSSNENFLYVYSN